MTAAEKIRKLADKLIANPTAPFPDRIEAGIELLMAANRSLERPETRAPGEAAAITLAVSQAYRAMTMWPESRGCHDDD